METGRSLYPGTIDDFRGQVLSLAYDGKWVAPDGTCLSVAEQIVTRADPLLHPCGIPLSEAANYRDPARARFVLTVGKAGAVIDAFAVGNQTRVVFRDGYIPPFERPAIGKPFDEFCEAIIQQGANKPLLAEQTSDLFRLDEAKERVTNTPLQMLRRYNGGAFSRHTAERLLEAIPAAYANYGYALAEGQWGPGQVVQALANTNTRMAAATVSRYLGTFRRIGIKRLVTEEGDIITIPHRDRKCNRKKT